MAEPAVVAMSEAPASGSPEAALDAETTVRVVVQHPAQAEGRGGRGRD